MKHFNEYLNIKKILWGLILIASVSSCTTSKQLNLLQDREPSYPMHPFEDYRLQKGDEVSCAILTSNKELADIFNGRATENKITTRKEDATSQSTPSSFVIYENGDIVIPFFGDVQIAGLTIPEAEAAIQRKMVQSCSDVQVRLILSYSTNNFYTLTRDGGKGQTQIYKDNMTIYQALASSGSMIGRNEALDLSKVKIVRKGADGEADQIKTFDLRTTSVVESEFYYIKPNDVIYFSTSSRSFWNISSFSSFVGTIIAPLTFLVTMKLINI